MNTRTPQLFLASIFFIAAPFTRGSAEETERARSYDVLHYSIDIKVNEVQKSVEGTVSIRVVPLHDSRMMEVDAADMIIHSVHLDTGIEFNVPVKHVSHGGTLSLELPRVMTPRDTFSVAISYSCTPRNGLYFNGPDSAYPNTPVQVWSQGEPQDNHFWVPCYDSPDDKASVEMRVTVNEKFVAISNGALLDVTSHPESKTATYFWFSAKPFSSYLISLVVGEYVKIEQWYRNIPIQYFVYPGLSDDAQRSFSKTPDMVKFFSGITRFDYPWQKYAQTVIANFTYSGMENTSATTLTDRTLHSKRAHLDTSSDALVAHELAHQWFGDLLTCRTWADAWLNEGFATYCAALYLEHDKGADEFQHEMLAKQRSVIASDNGAERRPTVTRNYVEPVDMFDYHIYARGACILHMLRFVLGDRMFWKGIQHYVDLHQYECVTTDDFRRAMEEASHQDLQWFFDEWVTKAGYPIFDVATSYDAASKTLKMTVRQTQRVDTLTPLYRMPVSIDVVTASGTSIRRIMLEPLPEQVIEIPSEQQPVDVIFDRGGWLLKRLHQHKPAESWIMQLHQGDVADRESALEHLGEAIDERNVLNAIGDVIAHDRFWGVRSKGAEALGLSLDGSILSMLAPALHDPEPKVRRAAAASLQAVSSEAAVGMLWTLVDRDSSDAVVGQAIASLVALDPLNGLAYCRKGLALNAHSSEICVASTHALGTLKSPEAKSLLMALSSYGQLPDVRIAAIDALAAAWPRDEAVRQRLEELLHDRLERVRRRSIEKLGIMGIIASRSMLQESLRHEEDAILRRETRRALARIDRAEKMTVHQ